MKENLTYFDLHPNEDMTAADLKELLPVNIPYLLSEMFVALIAVVGNSLTIFVFVIDRKLRRLTNYYIASLALADLLVGTLGVPFAILTSLGLPRPLWACLLMLSFLVVLCTISIFCLVAVSIDRYWAILYPLVYSRVMTGKIARQIIFACWCAGTLIGLLPVFGWHMQERGICIFTQIMDYDYLVFLYFFTIVGPGILIAGFYGHIYSVVLKQLRQIASQEVSPDPESSSSCSKEGRTHRPSRGHLWDLCCPSKGRKRRGPKCKRISSVPWPHPNCPTPQKKECYCRDSACALVGPHLSSASRREVKAAKNLSIIVLFFFICWFPLYTINCVQAFCKQCAVPESIMCCTIILSHANSAINPILYAYHMKDFRRALEIQVLNRLGWHFAETTYFGVPLSTSAHCPTRLQVDVALKSARSKRPNSPHLCCPQRIRSDSLSKVTSSGRSPSSFGNCSSSILEERPSFTMTPSGERSCNLEKLPHRPLNSTLSWPSSEFPVSLLSPYLLMEADLQRDSYSSKTIRKFLSFERYPLNGWSTLTPNEFESSDFTIKETSRIRKSTERVESPDRHYLRLSELSLTGRSHSESELLAIFSKSEEDQYPKRPKRSVSFNSYRTFAKPLLTTQSKTHEKMIFFTVSTSDLSCVKNVGALSINDHFHNSCSEFNYKL